MASASSDAHMNVEDGKGIGVLWVGEWKVIGGACSEIMRILNDGLDGAVKD